MRISTINFQRQSTAEITRNQADVARTQLQLATGRNILSPSDDPAGSKQILDLRQSIALAEQHQDNINAANTRLSMEESTLSAIVTELVRARELAVQSNVGTLTDTERRSLAFELGERLDQVLDLANVKDANNDYLFSGNLTRNRPFTANSSGGFDYNGDQGQRSLQISRTNRVPDSDPGSEVFMAIRNGNGSFAVAPAAGNTGSGVSDVGAIIDGTAYDGHDYTISFTTNSSGETVYRVYDDTASAWVDPASGLADDAPLYVDCGAIEFRGMQLSISGQPAAGDSFTVTPSVNKDLFSMIADLKAALEVHVTGDADEAKLGNAVSRFLGDMDQAMENIGLVQARVGARLNALDSQQEVNSAFVLFAEENLSDIQDLDYAEAASRLQLQMLTYQASQQSFSLVQGLSLFNYLG